MSEAIVESETAVESIIEPETEDDGHTFPVEVSGSLLDLVQEENEKDKNEKQNSVTFIGHLCFVSSYHSYFCLYCL
jgi:hypothetical protein